MKNYLIPNFAAISLASLLSVFNIVSAQNQKHRYTLKHQHAYPIEYSARARATLLFFGAGMVSVPNHTGNLNVSFPYQTIDVNGIKTSHTFNGNSDRLLSGQSPELTFGLDISKPFYALNFSVGCNTTYQGARYSIGYGRNIYLGQQHLSLKERIQTCTWILRPSLNIAAFSFSGGNLGSIDNVNTTIYLLGHEVKPTYIYSSGGGRYSNSQHTTVHANNLVINYKQNQIGIQPKIALCTNPYKTKMSIQLFVAYFIPIFQSGGLQLIQHSSTYSPHFVSGSASTKLKNQDDVVATYNNQSFHSVPFRANNISIGIVFGINF